MQKREYKFMSTSNWEDAKSRSNYHFNKWHKDTDCVQHMGKFTGGWQTELQSVIDDENLLIGQIVEKAQVGKIQT